MAKFIYGERIGKNYQLRVGCVAALFDTSGEKILLLQRSDNKQWCLPGGGMDAGESASECVIREVLEETGLHVEVRRLIGIYTTPHEVICYPDGNSFQIIEFSFEVAAKDRQLVQNSEALDFGYFTLQEALQLNLLPNNPLYIKEAFLKEESTRIH